LPVLLADVDPDDILVVADGDDLDWIDHHADLLPSAARWRGRETR
jgi:hypothetical protein